jgi:hypothetical protein
MVEMADSKLGACGANLRGLKVKRCRTVTQLTPSAGVPRRHQRSLKRRSSLVSFAASLPFSANSACRCVPPVDSVGPAGGLFWVQGGVGTPALK